MKRILFALGIAIVIAGVVFRITSDHKQSMPNSTPSAGASTQTPVPKYDHIFLIVEENKSFGDVIGSPDAPYINSLANGGSLLMNYHATDHPSLPNYLELTSGTNGGITNDCSPPGRGCEVSGRNIADEIEQTGRSWREYAESMPGNCGAVNSGEYATKHNPFVYYADILHNPARCQSHVVPFSHLATDLSAGQGPNYSFITPNLCNDMHDCSVKTGDNWLAAHVPDILGSTACTKQSCLVVITWDENDSGATKVVTVMTGTNVKKDYRSNVYYTHYSLLHTIEAAWGMPALTSKDGSAAVINDVF